MAFKMFTFIRSLRFNGDTEAFVDGDILDFIALLHSGSVLWFNRNMLACDERTSDDLGGFFTRKMRDSRERFQRRYYIRFEIHFYIWCLKILEKQTFQCLICYLII
jgi:hypothetical protein